jgi:uncharacterized lipoprotein YddW (UPF0748 family)
MTLFPGLAAAALIPALCSLAAELPGRAQLNRPAQAPQAAVLAVDPPEIRGLWVDAFHEGIRSPAEIDALIAAASRAHLNTLFVQVRRRGDALYTKGVEPPLDDPAYDPAFDALAYVVAAAHAAGIQVHAWVNAMPVWRDEPPPRDARHVFNRHGPDAPGEDNWFTASPAGSHKFPVGYFLDPGHPAAAAYLADIYLNLVRNYEVDGIHFDYIRYPETDERIPRGAGVGYNAVNLARFRRFIRRGDTPSPGDEAWMAWRRQQVTNLVRRISIEAKAIKPKIKISAALIPWGQPPTSEKNFVNAAPMQRIYQDWHQWMKDGLIDLAVPMNYATETDARVRSWFDGWIKWEKRHTHGRQLAVGLGAYRNTPEATLAQLERVRKPEGRGAADGVSFFSYAVPGGPPAVAGNSLAFLVEGAASRPGPFAHAATVPPMRWIDDPRQGWIAGTVTAGAQAGADTVVVKVKRAGFRPFSRAIRVWTDGNGYFGLTNVKPGRYRVWLDGEGRSGHVEAEVKAGQVTHVPLQPAAGRTR